MSHHAHMCSLPPKEVYAFFEAARQEACHAA